MRANVLKAALGAGGVLAAIVATLVVLLRDVEVPPVYQGGPSYTMAPPTSRPAPSPTPDTTPCVGTIREYCEARGKCPTYAESIERVKKYECKLQRDHLRLVVEHCIGEYRSISVRGLFGGETYFDASGKLIAAFQFSDAIGSFCNGASSSKTYGTIPTCSTEFVKVDVCKQ